MPQDKTRIDNNRRNLSFQDNHPVREVLPKFFLEEYPKLVTFLEAYYEYEDKPESPARLIHELFINRDITATDIKLLSFIEDELLLGQQYFEGFDNKRAAAKYSNTLYRSKGTLYSIEQFFRTFFSISPDVVYTKRNMFIVGESEIGAESQRFITDDKLYQKYALLVKASIPITEWKEAYKLFAHPAGMYIGGEVQIVTNNTNDILVMPDVITGVDADPVVTSTAIIAPSAEMDLSGIIYQADTGYRVDLNRTVESYKDITLEQLDRQYDNFAEVFGANSPTFDEDSADPDYHAPRFSSTLDTFDEVNYVWYDSDSA